MLRQDGMAVGGYQVNEPQPGCSTGSFLRPSPRQIHPAVP